MEFKEVFIIVPIVLLQELLELEHERTSLEEQEVFIYAFVLGIKFYKEIEQVANLL